MKSELPVKGDNRQLSTSLLPEYNGSIHEQQESAAMGSPVSAVIANLYMEAFEEQAIESAPYKPKIWKRYVDDTFTILDRGNVDRFLHHLNSQQPTIRFTMETEKESKIAFLDASVSREPDGRLTTSVYRKPTHTDQYLTYDSHHPQSKNAVLLSVCTTG